MLKDTQAYIKAVAELTGGEIKQTEKNRNPWIACRGSTITAAQVLEHEESWFAALEKLTRVLSEKIQD